MQNEKPRLIDRLRTCYHAAHVAAHRVEQPLHMSYLAAVYYSSHAAYGYIALLACLAMLLSWNFKS